MSSSKRTRIAYEAFNTFRRTYECDSGKVFTQHNQPLQTRIFTITRKTEIFLREHVGYTKVGSTLRYGATVQCGAWLSWLLVQFDTRVKDIFPQVRYKTNRTYLNFINCTFGPKKNRFRTVFSYLTGSLLSLAYHTDKRKKECISRIFSAPHPPKPFPGSHQHRQINIIPPQNSRMLTERPGWGL